MRVLPTEFPSPGSSPEISPPSLVEVAKEWDAYAEGWITGESTWLQSSVSGGGCGLVGCYDQDDLLVVWFGHVKRHAG